MGLAVFFLFFTLCGAAAVSVVLVFLALLLWKKYGRKLPAALLLVLAVPCIFSALCLAVWLWDGLHFRL